MRCTDKKCHADLYVIDSRSNIRVTECQKIVRYYCCPICGKRYLGLEVLNPVSYTTQPMPKSFVRKRNREIITKEVRDESD
jgi:transcriptional regulator NrdR family protein